MNRLYKGPEEITVWKLSVSAPAPLHYLVLNFLCIHCWIHDTHFTWLVVAQTVVLWASHSSSCGRGPCYVGGFGHSAWGPPQSGIIPTRICSRYLHWSWISPSECDLAVHGKSLQHHLPTCSFCWEFKSSGFQERRAFWSELKSSGFLGITCCWSEFKSRDFLERTSCWSELKSTDFARLKLWWAAAVEWVLLS